MYNKKLFQLEGIWETYVPDEILTQKTEFILDYIPKDVKSILDVGCGNGKITNSLDKKFEVIAIDNSAEALNYVKTKKILCSADIIPLDDSIFDLVFSSELLEHLPEESITKAILEMKRLTQKYILITVPYDEFLNFHSILCPICNKIFHAFGHLHSFNVDSLKKLLEDEYFKVIRYGTHGPYVKKYFPWLLNIRQKYGLQYYPPGKYTICPHCGNQTFSKPKRNLLTKTCNLINKIFSFRQPLWLFMLLSK
ncbi:MAG: class I SAM-dependent methyltransferase [Candidatus Atribacteria bacterium]|nr:class I SAM-dependent methyltransferase [Candidatus Atribacteria bacterium]